MHTLEPAWETTLSDLESLSNEIIESVFEQIDSNWDADIAVVLSNDSHVQELNADFRGKNAPTNVLSFPSDEEDALGDVIFALETIEEEAKQQKKTVQDHFCHLLVHGVLHLLGYDHIDENEAVEMESVEIAILSSHSIANPYE